MRPSDLVGRPEGSIPEAVEGIIAVVFRSRRTRRGHVQRIKVRDGAPSPTSAEVVVNLRDRAPIPLEARGERIRIEPRICCGGATGLRLQVWFGTDGRQFPELVATSAARIEIGGTLVGGIEPARPAAGS